VKYLNFNVQAPIQRPGFIELVVVGFQRSSCKRTPNRFALSNTPSPIAALDLDPTGHVGAAHPSGDTNVDCNLNVPSAFMVVVPRRQPLHSALPFSPAKQMD